MENKLKKYTLTDLKEKKIAVRIAKKDNFIKICNLLGYIPNSGDYSFIEYHGVDEDNEFVWLNDEDLEGRILLKSIDEIDLEEKEEPKQEANVYPFYYYAKGNYSNACAVCKEMFQGDKRATMCLECAIKQHHIDMEFCNSEIARLKEENQELKVKAEKFIKTIAELSQLNAIRESNESQQSERTRMAWELYVSGFNHGVADKWTIDECFRSAEIFLKHAKSKEVENGN